jgi:hypothetical protein
MNFSPKLKERKEIQFSELFEGGKILVEATDLYYVIWLTIMCSKGEVKLFYSCSDLSTRNLCMFSKYFRILFRGTISLDKCSRQGRSQD